MKTTVVIPDMQIPYQDNTALRNVIEFVREFKPDVLVNVGDDIDAPQTSYWCKGRAGEYANTLQADMDQTAGIHLQFRDALGPGEYHVSRSNHGDRTRKYIAQYAPALVGLKCLRTESLLGYDKAGITYHTEPFEVANGWWCAHGDEGTLSPIAGRTASLLAEKWGLSVVCGHTHRAGIITRSYGVAGKIHGQVTGMEVGHLMDLKQAGYLPGGFGDWQQAFGILYRSSRGTVTPSLIPIDSFGGFTVEGVEYGGAEGYLDHAVRRLREANLGTSRNEPATRTDPPPSQAKVQNLFGCAA